MNVTAALDTLSSLLMRSARFCAAVAGSKSALHCEVPCPIVRVAAEPFPVDITIDPVSALTSVGSLIRASAAAISR